MKFRIFQTLLVGATLITWVGPFQAFNTVNNTPYPLMVWSKNPSYYEWVNSHTTSKGWYYTGKLTSITLYVCAVYYNSPVESLCTPTVSCPVSRHGQQTVNLISNTKITATCN